MILYCIQHQGPLGSLFFQSMTIAIHLVLCALVCQFRRSISLHFSAWNTNFVSTCCSTMTKRHNWQIISMSVILFCHGWAACTYQVCASSNQYIPMVWWGSQIKEGWTSVRSYDKNRQKWAEAKIGSLWNSLSKAVCFISIGHLVFMIWLFILPKNKLMRNK